jgi:hypothetical protein
MLPSPGDQFRRELAEDRALNQAVPDLLAALQREVGRAVEELNTIAGELEPSWTPPPAHTYEGKHEAQLAERLRRIAAALDAAKGQPPMAPAP